MVSSWLNLVLVGHSMSFWIVSLPGSGGLCVCFLLNKLGWSLLFMRPLFSLFPPSVAVYTVNSTTLALCDLKPEFALCTEFCRWTCENWRLRNLNLPQGLLCPDLWCVSRYKGKPSSGDKLTASVSLSPSVGSCQSSTCEGSLCAWSSTRSSSPPAESPAPNMTTSPTTAAPAAHQHTSQSSETIRWDVWFSFFFFFYRSYHIAVMPGLVLSGLEF